MVSCRCDADSEGEQVKLFVSFLCARLDKELSASSHRWAVSRKSRESAAAAAATCRAARQARRAAKPTRGGQCTLLSWNLVESRPCLVFSCGRVVVRRQQSRALESEQSLSARPPNQYIPTPVDSCRLEAELVASVQRNSMRSLNWRLRRAKLSLRCRAHLQISSCLSGTALSSCQANEKRLEEWRYVHN